jgi:regulator of sirC expression with transglutaminase-like and TPR domain
MPRLCLPLVVVSLLAVGLHADEPKKPDPKSVELLAASARKSVVMILSAGRDGKQQGVGTGFVVAADGLIATNYHVIGEARPITVQMHDGKRYPVTIVHATDRAADLAVIRIDARDLTPLELADSETLKQGQTVTALGNPHGLEYSVVAGVVSGRREIDGQKMIQLAMVVEPGNSGGPLLDLQGRVHGILTLKSLENAAVGFAMPSNALAPLLKKPNPVPMARWLTIGALDSSEWKTLHGARWRQRAGRILVEGAGEGFGGRSLCLHQRELPPLPFEVAVTVKLDDESGAAGLVFHADGAHKHYGFYPTTGSLRFVRFEGPDVFTWKVLEQVRSPHYRPGDWNTLRVRIEKDRIRCYVNDQLTIESEDAGLTAGQVGLAKFRDTRAEFKNFRVGKELAPTRIPADVAARITKSVADIAPEGPPAPKLVETLQPEAAASLTVLRERARLLEQQAHQLRQLALAVHARQVQAELLKVLQGKEDDIDLLHAALLLARLDNDEVDVEAYRREAARMGKELAASLPKDADDKAKLAALNRYLFAERGFHGSRRDYYHRSNSYLNEVLDDREGLPITLSVVYMEMARHIGLKVAGAPLPGHFMVQHIPAKGERQFIDVYEGGQLLSREEVERQVKARTGGPLRDEHLTPAARKAIISRMLHNLMNVARKELDGPSMLRYLDVFLALNTDAAEERWTRALLRFNGGLKEAALEDVEWLLQHDPPEVERKRVEELRRLLTRPER